MCDTMAYFVLQNFFIVKLCSYIIVNLCSIISLYISLTVGFYAINEFYSIYFQSFNLRSTSSCCQCRKPMKNIIS